MDDLKTERTFDSQSTWVIDVLGLFFIHGCLYNQALADVRSTCARIKCLYCKYLSNMAIFVNILKRDCDPNAEKVVSQILLMILLCNQDIPKTCQKICSIRHLVAVWSSLMV